MVPRKKTFTKKKVTFTKTPFKNTTNNGDVKCKLLVICNIAQRQKETMPRVSVKAKKEDPPYNPEETSQRKDRTRSAGIVLGLKFQ